MPPNIGEAIKKVGELRKKLRAVAPGNDEGPKRMRWYVVGLMLRCEQTANLFRMSNVCLQWSLEDLCDMKEEDMAQLLQYYAPEKVPSIQQVRLGEDPDEWQFDGSFGWACVV